MMPPMGVLPLTAWRPGCRTFFVNEDELEGLQIDVFDGVAERVADPESAGVGNQHCAVVLILHILWWKVQQQDDLWLFYSCDDESGGGGGALAPPELPGGVANANPSGEEGGALALPELSGVTSANPSGEEGLRTSGTSWGQGAVSNANWGGAKLTDVLKLAGLDDPIEAQEKQGMEHVRFYALDEMTASIGIEKAMNPYGDVIICYEMNDEPLSRDHGFPLRAIIPGYAAVRNVKWLKKLQLSKEEAEGPWQRGLNYKILPPSMTDAKSVDLDRAPSMTEASLFSGISSMDRSEPEVFVTPGDTVMMKASEWAWAGGGRNIVRVDLSGDEGKTWTTATLTDGANQRFGRAWAWVFWEAEVPTKVKEDGSVHLASKAVYLAFNVQPEKCDHTWNVRGLGNNSWYHASAKVTDTL